MTGLQHLPNHAAHGADTGFAQNVSSAEGADDSVEVELTEKSTARLKAVLGLHAEWIAAGKSPAVIYVCGNDEIAERVLADGQQAGLSVERGTMRTELVPTIQREAAAACSTLASTEWHLAGSEAG